MELPINMCYGHHKGHFDKVAQFVNTRRLHWMRWCSSRFAKANTLHWFRFLECCVGVSGIFKFFTIFIYIYLLLTFINNTMKFRLHLITWTSKFMQGIWLKMLTISLRWRLIRHRAAWIYRMVSLWLNSILFITGAIPTA